MPRKGTKTIAKAIIRKNFLANQSMPRKGTKTVSTASKYWIFFSESIYAPQGDENLL